LVLSKEKYWDKYQKDCLKRISDLSNKDYICARQSLSQKITELKKEYQREPDPMNKKAIGYLIDTLEGFKRRIR
jgi:hypothetical protein